VLVKGTALDQLQEEYRVLAASHASLKEDIAAVEGTHEAAAPALTEVRNALASSKLGQRKKDASNAVLKLDEVLDLFARAQKARRK